MALIPIHESITGDVVDACIQIHRDLGPGLLESVYEVLLSDELLRRGRTVQRQLELPLTYRGRHFEHGFRIDLLVDASVIVEIKVSDRIAPVHARQLLTYLRLMRLPIGLVANFGMPRMIDGITRVTTDRFIP
jgi:iron complex transport system substrate-binding protein